MKAAPLLTRSDADHATFVVGDDDLVRSHMSVFKQTLVVGFSSRRLSGKCLWQALRVVK